MDTSPTLCVYSKHPPTLVCE